VLVEMTDRDYATFLERTVETFRDALVQGMGKLAEEATVIARAEIEKLLPQGRTTPLHHFRAIVKAGEPVGELWFAEQLDESPRRVFIFDIAVHEQQRGRGIGTDAIASLASEGRQMGAEEIRLAVFSHNTGAVRLYERLGFETIERGEAGMRMAKRI